MDPLDIGHVFILTWCFGYPAYHFFLRGFRSYRQYRLLADMPEIRIGAIPMGLVQIHGKAHGAPSLTSPVTKNPCFLYKVLIEEYTPARRSRFVPDVRVGKFSLVDATGEVLVDPNGAELDLIENSVREIGGSRTENSVEPGARASELESYCEEFMHRFPLGRMSTSPWVKYRLTEYCVLPGHWYDVTGTCVENPDPSDSSHRNMIVKGSKENTLLISWRSERVVEERLRHRATRYILGGAIVALSYPALLFWLWGWF